MADGALYGLRCMPDQTTANDAYYSHALPATVPGSPSMYASYQKGTDGNWYLNTYNASASSATLVSSSQVAQVSFPTCDTTANFTDGMTMGWGLVAVMAIAWGFTAIKRGGL